jgi:putative FmdB family regulatory protein
MPIFDFKCRKCDHVFEFMTRARLHPACPKCDGTDVEKQLSMFKVGAPAPTAAQKEKQSLARAGWVQVGKPFRTR